MQKEIDKKFADYCGYEEIEETDYGCIVGKNPFGELSYIPSPTSNVDDFYILLQFMVFSLQDLKLSYIGGNYELSLKEDTYRSDDFRELILGVFQEVF